MSGILKALKAIIDMGLGIANVNKSGNSDELTGVGDFSTTALPKKELHTKARCRSGRNQGWYRALKAYKSRQQGMMSNRIILVPVPLPLVMRAARKRIPQKHSTDHAFTANSQPPCGGKETRVGSGSQLSESAVQNCLVQDVSCSNSAQPASDKSARIMAFGIPGISGETQFQNMWLQHASVNSLKSSSISRDADYTAGVSSEAANDVVIKVDTATVCSYPIALCDRERRFEKDPFLALIDTGAQGNLLASGVAKLVEGRAVYIQPIQNRYRGFGEGIVYPKYIICLRVEISGSDVYLIEFAVIDDEEMPHKASICIAFHAAKEAGLLNFNNGQ